MKFLQVINKKKFIIINIFLFIYIILNLLDGDRGLISYFDKNKEKANLLKDQKQLSKKIIYIEHKVNLLSENIDLDYLETLYRQKFMVGRKNESIYNIIEEK